MVASVETAVADPGQWRFDLAADEAGGSVLRAEDGVDHKEYSEAVVLVVKSDFAGRGEVCLKVMSWKQQVEEEFLLLVLRIGGFLYSERTLAERNSAAVGTVVVSWTASSYYFVVA